MSARRVALVLLGALGVALTVKGFAVGPPSFGIEGAYFSRESGTPAYSAVFEAPSYALGSTDDGNFWLGAGIAALVLSLLGTVKPAWPGRWLLVVMAAPLVLLANAVGPPDPPAAFRIEPALPVLSDGGLWLGAAIVFTATALVVWIARAVA